MISSHSYGQFTSKDGSFTVDFVGGCAPLDVVITPIVPCECNIYFDGGIGNPVDDDTDIVELTHLVIDNSTGITPYISPGTYNLILDKGGVRDSIQIVVHEDILPEFSASSCSNRQVDIDIIDANYDEYIIDYGDGSPEITVANGNNPTSYTYALAGTYSIGVRGLNTGARDNCGTNNTSVQVVEVLSNAFITSLSLTSSTEITLDFTDSPDVQYNLEIQPNSDNATGFSTYELDIPSTSPLQVSNGNLDFDANFYCFRLATFDPCTNAIIGYSNTLCSVDLDDIVVNDLENIVEFNTAGISLVDHQIKRNTTNLFSLTTSTVHVDNFQIVCNVEYCYEIISSYSHSGNTVTSTSLIRCATALSLKTPTQILDISINATSDPILSWSSPIDFVADTYQVSTSSSLLGSSTTTNYVDNTIDPSLAPACYQIGYIDECDNTADQSNIVCSIYLSQNISNNTTTLKWTPYDGWEMGVMEYQLLKNGNVISTGSSTSLELASTQDIQKTTYQVIAIPNDGSLSNSLSNKIDITNRSNITFPNAFVANGTNNEFKVVGRYIVNFDLKIYTRWGELIAHITDQNIGWDGRSNGQILPEGNYIYSASIEDEAGNIHQRNGAVLLIRR